MERDKGGSKREAGAIKEIGKKERKGRVNKDRKKKKRGKFQKIKQEKKVGVGGRTSGHMGWGGRITRVLSDVGLVNDG